METVTLKAERREPHGKRVARAIRKGGRLPVIIYGHKEPPEAVTLDKHDVGIALQHGARIMELAIGGKKGAYLIKEVQYDHLGANPIHLDLMRVDLNEKVRVRVGIELRGTPKGVSEGGVLDQLMADIEVECLVVAIPETLHPMVGHLKLHDALYVKDLQFPAGVTALADANARVAIVKEAIVHPDEVAAGAVAGEEAPQQPEVIARGKKEEEGEGAEA